MGLRYRPEIDGLRTIAVVSVIIYHAEFTLGLHHLLGGGFLGVDIFFVISGFLITSLIINEYQKTGRFSIVNFYERRLRRLLPALLIVMLVSLPFAWSLLVPTQLIDFSKSLIASLSFSSNFYWHNVLGEYGTESALLKPFLHTWSLAVEEQYYIIFPLILLVIYRWFKSYTLLILTTMLLLSLLFAEWATKGHPSFSFYMLPSRFWELIAGGLLASILHLYPEQNKNRVLNQLMPIVGLLLILYSIFFIHFDATHPGFITLMPVLGTVFIIWFANSNDIVTKILSSQLFVAIGLISYSLYLWHYPIFAFGRVYNFNASVTDKFGWILLTVILSIITYYFIETPFRAKKRVTRKMAFISLFIALTIIGSYSFYTIHNGGLKERFPELIKIYGKNEFDNKILQEASGSILHNLAKSKGMGRSMAHKPSDFEANNLWFSDNVLTKKMLIIGNSHSKDLFNALYQNKEYFPHLEFARFGMHNDLLSEQIDKLLKSPNFIKSDIVTISFRYEKKTVEGIADLIDSIKSKSKKVLLVLNITEFDYINNNPVYDEYTEKHYQNFSIEELKRKFFISRNHEKDEINRVLRYIAKHKNISVLNKDDFICDKKTKTCEGVTDDGYKSFYDYGHFTLEGAKYFGRRIHEINWLKI